MNKKTLEILALWGSGTALSFLASGMSDSVSLTLAAWILCYMYGGLSIEVIAEVLGA